MMGADGVLVLGIGNVLRRDDGIGPRVVDALARGAGDASGEALPDGTVLRDGGTAGVGLLFEVLAARRVVVVDAVASPDPPGTISIRRGSLGDDGPVADLVATASLVADHRPDVTVVGIAAGDVDVGDALTPAVEAAIPDAVAAVIAAVRGDGGTAR